MNRPKRFGLIAIGGFGLLSLHAMVYWAGLTGGFFFDDSANILEPAGIQVKNISLNALLNVWESGIAGPLGRPISLLSFAANYYFSGFDPYWFKLTNLLIHCVNALLAYLFCLLLIRTTKRSILGLGAKEHLSAVVAAALWAFNPIQLTSVLYVVQRMTALSSMFVLIALLLHVWARQQKSLGWKSLACLIAAWGLFLPTAMLSKETGVLFLLYVAVYEAILQPKFAGEVDRLAKVYFVLLGMASVGLLLYIGFNLQAVLLRGYEDRTFTLAQRVLTEPRIIWTYIKMIVVPTMPDFGLYHDDFSISTGLFKPVETVFSIVGLVALFVSAFLARNKAPIVSFGIFWFLAGHSLESTIFPLELMHEHRNYLPSLGIVVLVLPVLTSSRMNNSIYRLLASSCALAFLVYFGLITHLRADMYGDDFRRTQIETGYRSESVRSQYEAGALMVRLYERQHEPLLASFAEKHFERVNELDPEHKLALIGMLQLDCLSDQSARVEVQKELKRRLASGKWNVFDRTAMHAIADMSKEGALCLTRGQVDALFDAALGNKKASLKDRSVVLSDYALYLWLGQKDYVATREVLMRAVSDNDNDVLNRFNLLQLSRLLGDKDGVLALIADLKGRHLSRQDRALLEDAIREMSAQGAITNNL